MKHNRAGQKQPVPHPPTAAEYDAAWWARHVRRCLLGRASKLPGHSRMIARAWIAQDVESDTDLLKTPKIEPFDSAEERRIWRMLHSRRITQRITRILASVAAADAPTAPSRRYLFHAAVTVADELDINRTQPITALR